MKGIIEMMPKKDTENTNGLLVIFTKGTIKMTKDTFMGKCIGMMVASTKESGLMEFSMDMVSCHLQQENKKKDYSLMVYSKWMEVSRK